MDVVCPGFGVWSKFLLSLLAVEVATGSDYCRYVRSDDLAPRFEVYTCTFGDLSCEI